MSDFKELVKNLYTSKNRELTPEKFDYIQKTYSNGKEQDFVKNFYATIGEDLTEDKLTYISDTYLKKKEPSISSVTPSQLPKISEQVSPLQQGANIVGGGVIGDISKTVPKGSIKEAALADKKKNESYLGALWNNVVGSAARLAGGAARATYQFSGNPVVRMERELLDRAGKVMGKNLIAEKEKEYTDVVKGVIERGRTSASSKEYERKLSEGFDVTDGVGVSDLKGLGTMIPQFIADMGLAVGTGGTSFALQGYDDALSMVDEVDKDRKMSEGTRLAFGLGGAIVIGLLDKLGLDNLVKTPAAKKYVTAKVIKEATDELAKKGVKVTAEQFENTVKQKASQLTRKELAKVVAKKGATSFAIEGGTEAAQEGVIDLLKIAANRIEDKQIFNEEEIKDTAAKRYLNSLVAGGALGFVGGAFTARFQNTQAAIKDRLKNVKNVEDIDAIVGEINENVADGTMTEEEANDVLPIVQNFVEVSQKVPADLIGKNKVEAVDLIGEREKLLEQIKEIEAEKAAIDPSFHNLYEGDIEGIEERVNEINKELAELAKPENNVEEVIVEEEIQQPIELSPELPEGYELPNQAVEGDVIENANKLNREAGIDLFVARKPIEIKGEKFVLSQIKENNNDNSFIVENDKGEEIGKAQLSADGNFLENIRIDEKYRRKGLATQIYDFIELQKGIELEPSPNKQSKEAKELWDKRNLQKSISKKANGGLLGKALNDALKQTINDQRNKAIKEKNIEREKTLKEDEYFMKGREKSQIEKSKNTINEKYDEEIKKINERFDKLISSSKQAPTKQGEIVEAVRVEQEPIVGLNKDNKQPFTTKTKKQVVSFENGDLIVRDAKTGSEVSPKTKKKALREYAESFDFTVGEKAATPTEDMQFRDENELNQYIVDNSQNPSELVEVYVNQEPTTAPLSSIERMVADYGIGKVTNKSFERFGDRNLKGISMAKAYFNNQTGQSIDQVAKEMSDHYDVEITPQDIADFMVRFPNGEASALRLVESEVASNAAAKFKELTGLNLNQEIAQKVIEQQFNKLSKAEQLIAQQDYESATKLEEAYWTAYQQTNGFTEEGNINQPQQEEARNGNEQPKEKVGGEPIAEAKEKLKPKEGHVYRAVDNADDAVGNDKSFSSKTNWYEGEGFLIEANNSDGKDIEHHKGAKRGNIKPEDVTTIYYDPNGIATDPKTFEREFAKMKQKFPNAEFVEIEYLEDEKGESQIYVKKQQTPIAEAKPKQEDVEDADIFYHSTNKNFEGFDDEKIGTNKDFGWFGLGHYFTSNKEESKYYGKNVIEINISKIKDKIYKVLLENQSIKIPKSVFDYIQKNLKNFKDYELGTYDNFKVGNLIDKEGSRVFSDAFKNEGYLGVRVSGDANELVIFESKNIPKPETKTPLEQQYEEANNKKGEKAKQKAKEKLISDNFDSIVSQLMTKNKIKRKC